MLTVVTGGAGFIGINLVARLLDEGGGVAVVDDFSGGSRVALAPLSGCDRMMVVEADMSDRGAADRAFDAIARAGQVSAVWHLAANSDIGRGVADPDLDLRRTSPRRTNVFARRGVWRSLGSASPRAPLSMATTAIVV